MTEKAIKIKGIVCSFCIFVFCFLFQTSCFAAHALLSEVEIKNTDGQYDITFQVNNSTNIKRNVIADDKIVLTLSSTSGIDNVPVIFEGEKNIDNIVLQKQQNNLKIFIKGNNINNSNIFFKETDTGLLKQAYSSSEKKLLNNSFINVLDAKFCIIFVISFSFMLLLFSFVKPQNNNREERLNMSGLKKKTSRNQTQSTIRVHSRELKNVNAPYIHYTIAAKGHSIPDDFKTTGQKYSEEKIKKYG